jgi:hypothetical protein
MKDASDQYYRLYWIVLLILTVRRHCSLPTPMHPNAVRTRVTYIWGILVRISDGPLGHPCEFPQKCVKRAGQYHKKVINVSFPTASIFM